MTVAMNCPTPDAQPARAGHHNIVFKENQLINGLQGQEIKQGSVLIGGDPTVWSLQHSIH